MLCSVPYPFCHPLNIQDIYVLIIHMCVFLCVGTCMCVWVFHRSRASIHLPRPALFSSVDLNLISICLNHVPHPLQSIQEWIHSHTVNGPVSFSRSFRFYNSRSVIYFGFLRLWCEVWIMDFIGLHMSVQWSQHPLLRRLLSLLTATFGYFWTSCSAPLTSTLTYS